MTAPVETAQFVAAMSQHFSSVCVITTSHQGKDYGLTATAMSSVCAEPPRLLVCVNKSGVSHEMIRLARFFCVNVLNERQEQTAKGFAGMLGKDFDRFSVGEWKVMTTGAPALVGATAVFDCKVAQEIDQFTHTIVIGDVVAVESKLGRDALLYGARKFRSLHKPLGEYPDFNEETLHF